MNEEREQKLKEIIKDDKKLKKFVTDVIEDDELMEGAFDEFDDEVLQETFGKAMAQSGSKQAKKIKNSTTNKARKNAIKQERKNHKMRLKKKEENSFQVIEVRAKKIKYSRLELDFEYNEKYEDYETYTIFQEDDIEIKIFYDGRIRKVNRIIRDIFKPEEKIGGDVLIIKTNDQNPADIINEDLRFSDFTMDNENPPLEINSERNIRGNNNTRGKNKRGKRRR